MPAVTRTSIRLVYAKLSELLDRLMTLKMDESLEVRVVGIKNNSLAVLLRETVRMISDPDFIVPDCTIACDTAAIFRARFSICETANNTLKIAAKSVEIKRSYTLDYDHALGTASYFVEFQNVPLKLDGSPVSLTVTPPVNNSMLKAKLGKNGFTFSNDPELLLAITILKSKDLLSYACTFTNMNESDFSLLKQKYPNQITIETDNGLVLL